MINLLIQRVVSVDLKGAYTKAQKRTIANKKIAKKSGKKPTAAMLKQEYKIKSKK